jgi:hypothetical protein
MTSSRRESVSSPLFHWPGRAALAVVFLVLMVTVGSPPLRAQSAAPEARTHKSETHAKKPRPAVSGQTGKPAGARAKRQVHGMVKADKPARESAAQSSPESDDKTASTPSVRRSETMDFDADAEDQKMEPGLELIQAAPRPARHRSLVPASPSPEDSVVNRE